MDIFILRGLPGSGKDYLIENYAQELALDGFDICSADLYWIRPDGLYDWQPRYLNKAHQWCYDTFLQSLTNKYLQPEAIFINNTNIIYPHFQKYISKAVEHNCEVILLEPNTWWKFEPSECALRNQHNVTKDTIEHMLKRWQPSNECAALIKDEFGINVKIQIGSEANEIHN